MSGLMFQKEAVAQSVKNYFKIIR